LRPRQAARRGRWLLAAVLPGAILYALWLLWVGDFDHYEVLAGLVAAAAGATVHRLATKGEASTSGLPLRSAGVIRSLLRLIGEALRDSILVLAATVMTGLRVRVFTGRFERATYAVGGSDAASALQRALSTAARSFTPNTCVIGFEARRGKIVVHRLVRRLR
jgi:multisubunit Na+/H+ antiporter MnhE subunit